MNLKTSERQLNIIIIIIAYMFSAKFDNVIPTENNVIPTGIPPFIASVLWFCDS
jgi:hypothetical protein